MNELERVHRMVRGVLTILDGATWFSLEAVTYLYNKKYPPSRIGKIIGFKVHEREIKSVLHELITCKYVRSEPFSFTDVTHDPPLVRYRLTQAGVQYFASLKS